MAEVKVIFVDVGQGDCTLLQLPDGRFMLVDIYRCPDHGIDVFKLLEDVLPEGSDGRRKLDILAITHAHDDHITGIGELYERFEIEWLWVPQHEDRKQIAKHFGDYQAVVDKHPEDKVLRPQGSRTPLNEKDPDCYSLGGGVTFRCFSPPGYIEIDESLDEEKAKQVVHENCLVLKIEHAGHSAVLTGDSDVACWKRVEDYYPAETKADVLDADVLHASHHGSRTFVKESDEDSEPWLDVLQLISPAKVVVSVGENNRHDHPDEDMMAIYREESGDDGVHETRLDGTLVFEFETGQLIADTGTYRDAYGWDDNDGGGGDGNGDDGSRGGGDTAKARRKSPNRLDNSASA
jgi:beta-lactamase superfamily II metal-dependent hydrolase